MKCSIILAYQGTVSTEQSFLSVDSVLKVDPSEVWSVRCYEHFTGILASSVVYTNNLNGGISNWDFAHRHVYLYVGYPEDFSSTECSLLNILKFQRLGNSSILRGIWVIVGTLISREGNILLSWNLQDILLKNRHACGQNLTSEYRHSICWYITHQRLNSSKIHITLNRKPKETHPLEILHTSLGSTLCTESALKRDWAVGKDSEQHSFGENC
jgi:hypothetical protein